MGLESLFLFTLLGGLAAGTYLSETCFQRERTGGKPWLVPLVVTVLFCIGMAAAATHVQDMGRAFAALSAGTINFGAGMTKEIAISGCFFVLALVDTIITASKKSSPFGLRIVTAAFAVIAIIVMGAAYTDVYGNAVWCNAPATVLSFLSGDLAMGMAFAAVLKSTDLTGKTEKLTFIVVNVVLAIALCLEIAAFSAQGVGTGSQIAALVIAPIASIIVAACASEFKNAQTLAIVVCVLSVVGVAIGRYAFYATMSVLL
jgi:DMSO reductase anchor subunit